LVERSEGGSQTVLLVVAFHALGEQVTELPELNLTALFSTASYNKIMIIIIMIMSDREDYTAELTSQQ